MHQRLNAFTRDLSRHIEGTADSDGLVQRVNRENVKFKLAIRKTVPDFRPFERSKGGGRLDVGPEFLHDEDPDTFIQNDSTAVYIDDVMDRARQ
jgi:hypothetical protein